MTYPPAEVIDPLKNGMMTSIRAYVRLGRGVVGNTTFGLWGVCVLALGLGIPLILCGYPAYALYELLICFGAYFIYQIITWIGVSKSPDAGVTADEDYVGVISTRQAARNHHLVKNGSPVLGVTAAAIAQISKSPNSENGDE